MSIDKPEQYEGKRIKVFFCDGTAPISGDYLGYTPAYDDPDERASISVDGDMSYELYEDEIERIEILG